VLSGQRARDCQADAAGCAGDEGDLAAELSAPYGPSGLHIWILS